MPAIVPRTCILVPGTPPLQTPFTLSSESRLGSRAIARHATSQAGRVLFAGQRTSSSNLRCGFAVLRTWITTSVSKRGVEPSGPTVVTFEAEPAPLPPPRLHPASIPAKTTASPTLRHISLRRYTPRKGSTSVAHSSTAECDKPGVNSPAYIRDYPPVYNSGARRSPAPLPDTHARARRRRRELCAWSQRSGSRPAAVLGRAGGSM